MHNKNFIHYLHIDPKILCKNNYLICRGTRWLLQIASFNISSKIYNILSMNQVIELQSHSSNDLSIQITESKRITMKKSC